MNNTDNIEVAIADFARALSIAEQARFERLYPSLKPNVYTVERGPKFSRIVSTTDGGLGQRSAHVFVENATGLIWKAAGWKGPAKNYARGSVLGCVASGDNLLRVGR